MRGAYDEIRGMGAEVLAVSFAPARKVVAYREVHPQPFPVVADPDRAAYRALGLGSAGWAALFRPRVWLRYLRLIGRGMRPERSGEDVHQLGGDFVIDGSRRLVYAHRSTDPADRPPVADLLRALRRASGSRGGGSS